MMRSPLFWLGALTLGLVRDGAAQSSPGQAVDSAAVSRSVQQLRDHHGQWTVETDFLNPDQSVARRTSGTYRFDWALKDRILVGVSAIPEMGTASGILFYIAPGRGVIEMVSVGGDGMLWTMTGALGGEVRQTQPFRTQTGGEGRLRFTRSQITPDSFESRMEYSEDDGKTWLPGNHQRFRRAKSERGDL